MVVRMQETRLRIKGIRVKTPGIIVGMWGMQGIRMGIWGKCCGNTGNQIRNAGDLGAKKGFMNGNEIYKEWRGTKTKTNVFVYNYILRNFFTNQVVSHF